VSLVVYLNRVMKRQEIERILRESADFSDMDLSYADLSGLDLSGALYPAGG